MGESVDTNINRVFYSQLDILSHCVYCWGVVSSARLKRVKKQSMYLAVKAWNGDEYGIYHTWLVDIRKQQGGKEQGIVKYGLSLNRVYLTRVILPMREPPTLHLAMTATTPANKERERYVCLLFEPTTEALSIANRIGEEGVSPPRFFSYTPR